LLFPFTQKRIVTNVLPARPVSFADNFTALNESLPARSAAFAEKLRRFVTVIGGDLGGMAQQMLGAK
jgi:hypothetical protein